MVLPITQIECISYARNLNELSIIENFYIHPEILDKYTQTKKRDSLIVDLENYETIFSNFSQVQLKDLKDRIKSINAVHSKFRQTATKESANEKYSLAAANLFNTSLKTILIWNTLFAGNKELEIISPREDSFQLNSLFVTEKIKSALDNYLSYLANPKLMRSAELNDRTKGNYQIVIDPEEILKIQDEVYNRLFQKALLQNFSLVEAHRLAKKSGKIGVIVDDLFWLLIRDPVIAPSGYRHTYNRLIMKSDLDRVGGAAALPILKDGEEITIILQVASRHATQSMEFEIARGFSRPEENSKDTAKREMREESGYDSEDVIYLGAMPPDTGTTATVVDVYLCLATKDKGAKYDKTEAIKRRYHLTLDEVKNAFKQGYYEVEINNEMTKIPFRDPFLAYALLMAHLHHYITL